MKKQNLEIRSLYYDDDGDAMCGELHFKDEGSRFCIKEINPLGDVNFIYISLEEVAKLSRFLVKLESNTSFKHRATFYKKSL